MHLTQVSHEQVRLPEQLSYASLHFSLTLLSTSASTYIIYFYTDVLALPLVAVSAMLFLVRLADGLIDPLIGFYMDRRTPKSGKYRGYVLPWTIPFCLTYLLLFSSPPWSGLWAVLWCGSVYLVWTLAHSVLMGAGLSLLVTITADRQQRQQINTVKIAGAVLAVLVVNYCTLELVEVFGAGSEGRGYFTAMAAYAAVALLACLPCAFRVRERNVSAGNAQPLLRSLRVLAGNKKLVFILLMFLLQQIASAFRSQTSIYYMKYYMDLLDWASVFLLSGVLGSLAMQPVILRLSRRFQAVPLMAAGLVGCGFSGLLMGLAGRHFLPLILANVLYGIMAAFPSNLIYVYIAGLADEYAQKQSYSMGATVNSMLPLFAQVSSAVAGLLIPMVLAFTAYTPNQAQEAAALAGIRVSFLALTLLFNLLAALFALLSGRAASQVA